MPDYRLVDYINQSLRAGYSRQQIRQSLLNSGWPHQQVDEALNHMLSGSSQPPGIPTPQPQGYPKQARPQAQQIQHAQPGQQKPLGILQKFRMVLAHPGQFFDAVKNEQGYEAPVKFYLFIMFIHAIIMNAIFLLAFSLISSISGIGSGLGIELILVMIFSSILSANISVLLSIAFTFLGAAVLHLIAVIFGAKRGFQNTYKALIYASAPSILVWPVMGLLLVNSWAAIGAVALIYIWAFILQVKGLSRLHEISGSRAFAISITPIIIVVLLAVIIFSFLFSYMV